MVNSYDEVAYPSAVFPRTHPDGLAVLGTLSGMTPAPVEKCRVLELACSDGTNLISMAYGLPGSQFVGLDLAAAPIARGAAMIEKLGLKNITLQTRDVLTIEPGELGEFDYIIAHGFYSWSPPRVRAKIMELCAQHLSAQGIAYISFNAYPGHHLREISRGMMRFHMAHFPDPVHQIGQARAVLKMATVAGGAPELYRQMLAFEEQRIGELSDGNFFHDDLNPHNQPFYFHEFMAEARRHGLQFHGEADLAEKEEPEFSPQVRHALAQLDPDDIVVQEQYRDFLRGRTFRRTLLCREGIALNRTLDSAFMDGLFVGGELQSAGVNAEGAETFCGPGNLRFQATDTAMKAALRRIGATWPLFVPFRELAAQATQDIGDDAVGDSSAGLAEALLEMAIHRGVQLRTSPPHCAADPGPRPVASALARLQAESGARVATLQHRTMDIEDDFSRHFIRLLDGSRDRSALRQSLQEAMRRGQLSVQAAMSPEAITDGEVERVLKWLARVGLLVASDLLIF